MLLLSQLYFPRNIEDCIQVATMAHKHHANNSEISYKILSMIYRYVTHAPHDHKPQIRRRQSWHPGSHVIDACVTSTIGNNGQKANSDELHYGLFIRTLYSPFDDIQYLIQEGWQMVSALIVAEELVRLGIDLPGVKTFIEECSEWN